MHIRALIRHRAVPLGAIALILVVTVLTRLPHLDTGPLDYDEGVYWLSLRSMRNGNALFSSVFSSQPPAFLQLAEPPWAWLGGSIVAGRTVMLVWSLVTIVAGGVAAWRLAGRVAAVATALLLAVTPQMVHQSGVLQAEAPAMALMAVSLAGAAVAVTAAGQRARAVAAFVCGAALAAGLLTKLLDVAALPALAVLIASTGGRRRTAGLALAGAAAAAAAVLLPLINAWGAMWDQVIGVHVSAQTTYPRFNIDVFIGFARTAAPLIAIALVGAVLGWRHSRRAVVVGLVWVLGAVVAMVATRPLFPHHAVTLVPGLALLGGLGVARVVGSLQGRPAGRRRLVSGLVLGATGAAAAGIMLGIGLHGLMTPAHPRAVAELQRLVPSSSLVLGDDQWDQAAAGRDAPPPFVDTSGVRLNGAGVTATALEAYLHADSRVCAVILSGRLNGVRGFATWVAREYPERWQLMPGAVLYTRAPCGAASPPR
jgi:4-amino-4-deoxy-L-arabinose transferase-like glycosyltransferase